MRRAVIALAVASGLCVASGCNNTGFAGSGKKAEKPVSKPKPGQKPGDKPTSEDLGTTDAAGTDSLDATPENPAIPGVDGADNIVTPAIDSGDSVVTPTVADIPVTAQEGRTVEACFSYDKVKMAALVASGQALHGHWCNAAEFNVFLSGSGVGRINLNNRNDNDIGGFPPAGGVADISGPSVLGGKFAGRWIDGKFDVEIQCAIGRCHEDVTFLSIIGEVVMSNGKKMWLKIDQGVIYPNQKYAYKFDEFTLSEVKPSFGGYCELQ